MRNLAHLIVLLGACLLARPLLAADAIVTVESGQLRGVADGEIDVFKAVPFAAPPVGDLRWRAPQPPKAFATPRRSARDARKRTGGRPSRPGRCWKIACT